MKNKSFTNTGAIKWFVYRLYNFSGFTYRHWKTETCKYYAYTLSVRGPEKQGALH